MPEPYPVDLEAIARMNAEHAKQGAKLDWCAMQLHHVARVLRGEDEDHTGLGAWRIFVQNLELIMGVKVIDTHYYKSLVENQKPRT